MELIALISLVIAGFASLGLLAGRFGADSRATNDQDPGRTYSVRFV